MTRAGGLVASLVTVLAVVACAGSSAPASPTTPAPAASRTPGPAVERTRAAIEAALGARRVQLRDPQVPYRPAEPGGVADVPRAVFQAVLPADPSNGYIVAYDFGTEAAARAGAEAVAAYVGSPVGRVNFPFGTRFVVRRLGPSAIFYAEPPESPDPQAQDVADALRSVGTEVVVPS